VRKNLHKSAPTVITFETFRKKKGREKTAKNTKGIREKRPKLYLEGKFRLVVGFEIRANKNKKAKIAKETKSRRINQFPDEAP